jgi:hypothetical protein
MKDPKAIRKAIMAAKSIAAMVDPHFARVPLPEIGEPAPEMVMPEPQPQQFSMGGRLPARRFDDPFEKFHSQDPWLSHLPDHQYAAGGEVDDHVVNNPMSVFPKPQRMWDEDMPGGAYLSMPDKEDVTGHRAAQASIGIGEGGKPYFHASRDEVDETGTPGKGSALVKTNLFKQRAGWHWLHAPEGHENTGTIVSVEHRGNHHYVMDAHFPNGVDLSRYPDASSEPRLRPTTRGNVELGPQVGSILVRGREHPVHSHAIVREYGGRVGYADGGMPDDEQEITSYHGSANEFPEFSMGARSRGQGQSAFGEGHNFAEDEDVAHRYRDMTAREQMQGDVVHKHTGEALSDDAPGVELFKNAIRFGGSDLSHKARNVPHNITLNEKRIQEYEDYRDQAKDDPWIDENIAEMRKEINNLRQFSEIANTHKFVPKGHMYEVGLRVNPSKLLKWHEPVEAQPEAVQRYLVENKIEPKADWVGRDIYRHLSNNPEAEGKFLSSEKHSGKFANQILHGLGVHGIQWKDTDSQIAPGRGKSNYTIWDDSRVKVRKRYALGGMPDDDGTPDYAAPDNLGLYSHAAATAASLPQAKASPAEFRNMLTNRGVKPSEFHWSGYDSAFASQPQITREQVAAHFHENKPEIQEKAFRERPAKEDLDALRKPHREASEDYRRRRQEAYDAGRGDEFDPNSDEYAQRIGSNQRELQALKDNLEKPQYGEYTIPGGENYREILLKHKRDDKGFSASHFEGEPNILTHLRMKDRHDTNRDKVLHLDELQSDWAQEGRKQGFANDGKEEADNYKAAQKDHADFMRKIAEHEVERRAKAWESAPGRGPLPDEQKQMLRDIIEQSTETYPQSTAEKAGLEDEYHKVRSALYDARKAHDAAQDRMYNGVQPAPYVTSTNDWVDLGLKRALLEAAKGGHDKLAWTQGDDAADRYDLSKHIAKIDYIRKPGEDTGGYLLAHGHHAANIINQPVDVKDLPGMIGKDVAEKLLATKPQLSGNAFMPSDPDMRHVHSLEGLDLKVGGEGMRKFYDEILPKRLMRLAKTHDPDAKFSSSTVRHRGPDTDEEDESEDHETNLHALNITPRMRESILKKGFPAYAAGGEVGNDEASGYQDPETQHISDWKWRPVEDVQESLGGLKEIPSHVEKFGDFMDNIAKRAGSSGLTPRDLIKAYTITRSSIQRRAADVSKLRASGLALPEEMTGEIRPEGAFGEWLHTPAGQAYLDAAEKGKVHQTAIQNAIQVMAPFGRHKTDIPDALTWAALNLPGKEKQVSELVHAGHLMASTPDDWRAFTQHIRGVGPSKSGFLASLMGRGDQPTLDARQIILHTGRPTKEAGKYIAKKGGAGGVEAVDRLAARQSAMNLSIPDRLKPYYQHLTHHAVWDKAGNDQTTHEDVVRAMHHAASGGAQNADEQPDMLQHPVAKIFQTIGMAGLGDPTVDPEKFKEYLKRAQYALARKITTKGSDVLAANPGAANVKMSQFGKPLSEMESTTVSKGMMLPRKEADLEAMQRRKARLFPFLGDMSPADQILLKSGSLALVDPSEQQGGSDFMRSEFAKGSDPAAYGNRIGAAKTLAKKIASQTPEGTPAIGTHVAMGLGSVDSSHHAYEPILRMIPNSPIAQKHIEEFDNMMREALPPSNKYPSAWPGIMNTKEAEQFFASRPGTHASFFTKKIDSSKWQKAGFPDVGEVRFSASNPEMLGNPRLSTGHAFSEVEPSGRVISSPDLKHRTYPALIPSEGEGYLGGSSTPIPSNLMFSDFYKSLKTKDRSGKAIDYESPSGQTLAQQSLMTKVPYQDATQEWLDNIMEDRRQKQEQGFKKGGRVRSALMIAKELKKR